MAGGELGRAKVKGKLTPVGEVAVGGAPCIGQCDGAQASEAIEVRDVGGGTREKEDRRLIVAGRTGEPIGYVGGCLEGKGVE